MLRGLLIATVLVVLYYVLPFDRGLDAETAVRLAASLLIFAGVMVWQVRSIASARYPGLRAVEALGLIVPLFLLIFASTYFLMERASAASFTEPLTRTDALYFTVTVFATVGFGDIAAESETARVVVIGANAARPRNSRRRHSCAAGRCAHRSRTTIRYRRQIQRALVTAVRDSCIRIVVHTVKGAEICSR